MGKTTAAKFLQSRGAKIMDTDQLARELVEPGQPALAQIKHAFGPKVLAPDGSLNRGALGNIVFNDARARKKLEDILHPRIRELWLAQVESWRGESCPLAVVVIPLLYETRAESYFDKIICVACSEKSRHERLQKRGWTSEQIEKRITAQMPIEDKIGRAGFIIWSEGDFENHSRQVDCILKGLAA